MPQHHQINYVEFPSRDLAATQRFFEAAFGWGFVAYGPDYIAFSGQGLDGGFFRADPASPPRHGAALVVLYSQALETTLAQVSAAGGVIHQPIFAFPGGRRFHFIEPGGNELAVWADPDGAAPT
jgi:uncharacterized protein